jgi:hypothetical protein
MNDGNNKQIFISFALIASYFSSIEFQYQSMKFESNWIYSNQIEFELSLVEWNSNSILVACNVIQYFHLNEN